MAKPLPALGLVIGVIATYAAMVCASYATMRVTMRIQVYDAAVGKVLPWVLALAAIALVLGVLMMVPVIGSGVTTGAGLLLTVVGLAIVLLPVRQAFDLSKLFQFPGTKYFGSYLLFDGSFIVFGIPLLLIGIRRWAVDAKLAKLTQGPGQLQDGYQQPQQWGGYPGQQQQPPR
ncbi:hypothetical protein [Kribbella kalugense]|uniref:Uncharacterized protein n=1 Tax=Kribbella kalugense TaxID=2512221 RepID=A0A4R7ZL55_9ACTN|nr:hypothetical protein [Kribbella kalugense]TDW15900.1 hypothetical protein EV650_7394 [Kribbella kalugense]